MHIHRQWQFTPPVDLAPALLEACANDALIAQVLFGRGLANPSIVAPFLDPGLYQPTPPEAIPDLALASGLLAEALKRGDKILIWGDFDVDGQTSTALLYEALRHCGGNAVFYLPSRATESHGIRVDSLARQVALHQPQVLLTCDTGVTEYEALAYAQAQNIMVIVTDHHDLGEQLPQAQAVVNPKRLPPQHPLITLPGVGVAFKLIQHLYGQLGQEQALPQLLDLVALGIVADVAAQVNDTRYLLQIGLEMLCKTPRVGLRQLMEVLRIVPETISADQIGHLLGPRLNALGRLGDASLGVELLTTDDKARAAFIVGRMEELNQLRKGFSEQIIDHAEQLIASNPQLLEPAALFIYEPTWNPAILGNVANQMIDRYQRPVLLLGSGLDSGQAAEANTIASGSARSIAGFDVHMAIAAQADLLRTFGGHPGAAGLSLRVEHLDAFRARFLERIGKSSDTSSQMPTLHVDLTLGLAELAPALVQRLEKLSPFGEGNPPITVATLGVRLSHMGTFGAQSQHRRMTVQDDEGNTLLLKWWHGGNAPEPEGRFDVAYQLGFDRYHEVEGEFIDFRGRDDQADEPALGKFVSHDWRREADPYQALQNLLAEHPQATVWGEGYTRQSQPGHKRRGDLQAAEMLIIYTAPPDPITLSEAIRVVGPSTIHVIGALPPIGDLTSVLRQLSFGVRNAVQYYNGEIPLALLCGAAAQSVAVVRAGLDYLSADGQIGPYVLAERAGKNGEKTGELMVRIQATPNPRADRALLRTLLDKLRHLCQETEAYRRYFRGKPLKMVLRG
jgi:single-stranded-DNA-specific exonuclease